MLEQEFKSVVQTDITVMSTKALKALRGEAPQPAQPNAHCPYSQDTLVRSANGHALMNSPKGNNGYL